jgi:exosome complex component CSL4
MTEQPKIMFPGDFIANEEVFLPGPGTFAEQGKVKAAGFGVLEQDMKKREVKIVTPIKTPLTYSSGDVAVGVVGKVRDNVAFIDLIPSEDEKHRFAPSDASAVLRVTEVKREYVKSLTNEIHEGDIVRVKIIEATPYNVSLSIKAPDLGVIKAFCSRCRTPMELEGKTLVCPQCNWKDHRKLSEDYRAGKVKK